MVLGSRKESLPGVGEALVVDREPQTAVCLEGTSLDADDHQARLPCFAY
jgi:hypothetical protein